MWATKKQTIVAKSSAGAKHRSLASLVAELTWITYILRDIGISLLSPPLSYTNNISAMHLTKSLILRARAKHIELDYNFIREKVDQGAMHTKFVPSQLQIADVFHQTTDKGSSLFFQIKLGVVKFPSPACWEGDEIQIGLT